MASPDQKSPLYFAFVLVGFLAFWIVLVVLFAAQTSMVLGQDLAGAVRGALGLWLPWIVVSPLMLAMAFLLPVSGRRLWLSLPLHVVACVLILTCGSWLSRTAFSPPEHDRPMGPPPGYPPPPGPPGFRPPGAPPQGRAAAGSDNFIRSIPVGIPLYVVAVLVVSSFRLRQVARERERHAAELARQLAATRLETLRSQLQPHFLFNTLNTLASLVHTDPAAAEDVILNLSSLLRATMDAKDKPLIPLRQELGLARDYLAIQRARYGGQLQVEEDIAQGALSCAVPPLILQPILENAVKHAVDQNPNGARLLLRVERVAEKLVLEVEDSGAGDRPAQPDGHGIGVANVRARLAASFPGKPVAFDLLPNTHGGITARLAMPVEAPSVS